LERLSTLLLENGIFDPRTPSEAQECLNQIESAVGEASTQNVIESPGKSLHAP
jgi:hypothetical protein